MNKMTENESKILARILELKLQRMTYLQMMFILKEEGLTTLKNGGPMSTPDISKLVLKFRPDLRMKSFAKAANKSRVTPKQTEMPLFPAKKIQKQNTLDIFYRQRAAEYVLKSLAKDKAEIADLILTAEVEDQKLVYNV